MFKRSKHHSNRPSTTRGAYGVLTTLVLLREEAVPAKKLQQSEQQVDTMVAEAALAMRLLRDRMRPALPCALVADGAAWAHLGTLGLHSLWDRRVALPDPAKTTATMLAGLPRRAERVGARAHQRATARAPPVG